MNLNPEQKSEEIFKNLNAEVDDSLTEIESLCMNCYKQGVTKLMLTKIPFFREVIISSFRCEECYYTDTSIQSAGAMQEKGTRYTLNVTSNDDLNRQVIKSDYAVFSIPELEFEQPQSRKGEISTVEGLMDSVITGLEYFQEERKIQDPENAIKLEKFLLKFKALKNLEKPFTIVLSDPTGNSFIENSKAPFTDEKLTEIHFLRNHQQDIEIGCCAEDSEETDASVSADVTNTNDANWNFNQEVVTFKTNCFNCNSLCDTNMKMVDIPFFKQIVLMATSCESCGQRDNEVKGGTGIEPRGHKIDLLIKNKFDLNRDVLKSDTAGVKIPDLDFEMVEGSLGGRFTTVEGLLVQIKDQLRKNNPFSLGDSSHDNRHLRMDEFCEKLNKIICGEHVDVHLIVDDPAGNSFIQNLKAPNEDPQLKIEFYDRSFDQNEQLGLNDMNTENYTIPTNPTIK